MSAEPASARHVRFSPATDTGGDGPGGVWPMVRMLIENGVPTDRMAMIRWDRLPPLLGPRWPEVEGKVGRLVLSLAGKALGAGSACVRFDDRSVLLVLADAGGGARDRKVEAAASLIRRSLFGALRRDEMVEAWTVHGADADGLVCERLDGGSEATAAARPPVAEEKRHSLVLGDTDFSFFPLWEVRRNSVFFYVCEPFWTLPDGGVLREDALAGQFASPRHVVALDVELLRNAAEVAADVMEQDRMAQVLVPVHYSTLVADAAASRYAGEIRKVAYQLQERAYFEVVGVPAEVDRARLGEIVGGLRSLCHGVCVRVDFGWQDLTGLAAARVFAVGLSLRADNRREADIIADLDAFAARAAAASLRSYVHGIRTTSLSVAATCSGFDFIGSEALAATLDGCALDDYLIKPIDLYKRISRTKG